MGYAGRILRMPLNLSGYQEGRDKDLLAMPALVSPSRNNNYHENGLGKRGGTEWVLSSAIATAPIIRGGMQFRLSTGSKIVVWATSEGKVYYTSESNTIKSGMSTTNFFNFSYHDDKVYICDGNSIPQYWDGNAANSSNVTVPTDWATTGYPFQMVQHSRGQGIQRNWAICRNGIYGAKIDNGTNFGDADVIFIPISAEGGLVGAADFGGALMIFSKTKAYILDDSDPSSANWGYKEAIWEGGVAHWRLICKAMNDLFLMTEDGLIYSIRAVQATGDYQAVPLTRPAFMDRYIRENVTLSDIDKFHVCYDRKIRAIKWFVESGSGSNTNQALVQFIDKAPEMQWSIHDNLDYSSGYNAACSFEVQVGAGDWQVYTGDFSGMIWKLEQSSKSDHGDPYTGSVKWKPFDLGNPRMWKHFRRCKIRTAAQGNFSLTVRIWVDGVRKTDVDLTVSGTGALFDAAVFDTSTFSSDQIVPEDIPIGAYGYKLELEILNASAGEDYFHSELTFDFKEQGIR